MYELLKSSTTYPNYASPGGKMLIVSNVRENVGGGGWSRGSFGNILSLKILVFYFFLNYRSCYLLKGKIEKL